jgi:hypothetical protein
MVPVNFFMCLKSESTQRSTNKKTMKAVGKGNFLINQNLSTQ